MEDIQRHKASRKGHRAHLTKVLRKADDIMEGGHADELQIATLKSIVETLAKKKTALRDLNELIATATEDPDELEREIFEAEDTESEIVERSTQISAFIVSLHHNDPTHVSLPSQNLSETNSPHIQVSNQENFASAGVQPIVLGADAAVPNHAAPTTQPVLPVPPATVAPHTNYVSRLPRLNLPTFSGNPLNWFTFWDSFDVAVNANPNLGGVQKFNYLKAQLTGDASRAIAGFPLTNSNYERAIDLLKERFGQTHKIVSAHMQAFLELPGPNNKLASLQRFYDSLENHVRGLESLGKNQDTYGDLLVPIILGKLPIDLRKNLARDHSSPEWTFQQLREAIGKEIRILEAGVHGMSGEIPNPQPSGSVTASFITQTRRYQAATPRQTPSDGRKKCAYCKGPHPSNDCSVITDCQRRWTIVKGEGLCFNCLGHHRSSLCQSRNRCRKCRNKHHTSLCTNDERDSPAATNVNANANEPQPTSTVHTTLAPISPPVSTTTLLKTAIAPVGTNGSYCEANILFDEGAQRSFITKSLATKLQLQPEGKENISLSAFGAQTSATRSLTVATIQVVTETAEEVPVHVLTVDNIAAPLQLRSRAQILNTPHLQGLKLAHPVTSDESFEISLLIGADHYWDIVQNEIIRGDGPTAMQSKLGYLLSGPLESSQASRTECAINLLHFGSTMKEDEYDMERFWSLESMGITQPDEGDAPKNFLDEYRESSITRTPDGSYTAKFPWKEDHPPLPSNHSICERRTRSMARRLSQTPELLKTYGNLIKEQEHRGFIERVDTVKPSDRAHYIPHHPVTKQSSTTPIRIVYDCSCRQSKSSACLNDCLMVGPPYLIDRCALILRFRTYSFGLSTDIEKAFLHVGLDELDRDFTRFLWLSDPTDPESSFQAFRFKVVLFGSASSSFMLNATLRHHLDHYDSPVARKMKDDLYVDNIISGCDSEEEAIQFYEEARTTMAEGNFNLRSWASNSPALQALATEQNTADTSSVVNILGLRWNLLTDTLSLTTRKIHLSQLVTKRDVLRESSKIYDPLGIIAPVTIRAKILMQELWQQQLEWDEPLPAELVFKWGDIARDIQEATKLQLPRPYFLPAKERTNVLQLHVFADASPKAYGAAAYIRDETQTALVIAKSRVAPLKKLTLPQLELMAALVGARLAHFVKQAVEPRFNLSTVKLWSDSEIVLHWLNSNKQLKQFVANRIREIKRLFPVTVWDHCPTLDNPADLLTRGITAEQLHTSVQWKDGPEWLPFESQWPSWNPTKVLHVHLPDIVSEETVTKSTQTEPPTDKLGIDQVIDVSRYSTLNRLLNVTAYVLRLVAKFKKQEPLDVGPLTAKERCDSLRKWIQNCQASRYSQEITNILSNSSSRLPLVRQLRLFIDNDGFLRCGGRIHNAPLKESAKFPYLLPSNHPFTTLVVYEAHMKQLHSGVNSTVTSLRQNYWIPSIRQYVKKLLRRCVTCRKLEGAPYKAPDPAPLPKLRIQEAEPFAVTGVDFTGPLYVRAESAEMKAYICLFTCGVTRAVHLEAVPDLSERTFLQAFRRFASRKSLPHHMISDNASTYLAAAEELRQLFQSPSLKETFSRQGVNWKFIPKRAPWYGGFWERLIGLSKKTLKKTLGRTLINFSELQTLAVEVEAILNDRPLTYVSSDVADEEPLTPSHLLYGRRITSLPHPVIDEDELTDPTFGNASNVRQQANKQAVILQRFRSRWKHEYLTSLREFHRTSGNNNQSIQEGEVVLVHDETPRSYWRLAVIESVIKGGDGLIRAANIRTSTGRTNRPITKLYPLEIPNTEAQETPLNSDEPPVMDDPQPSRPKRATALEAMRRIAKWSHTLRAPPEDVGEI